MWSQSKSVCNQGELLGGMSGEAAAVLEREKKCQVVEGEAPGIQGLSPGTFYSFVY